MPAQPASNATTAITTSFFIGLSWFIDKRNENRDVVRFSRVTVPDDSMRAVFTIASPTRNDDRSAGCLR